MEELLGSTSKAFKAKESCGNTSDKDCSNEDELSFISRKIQSMWKHKRGLRWKNNFRKHTKETKDKTQMVCYECKKSGYFKSKHLNLEKEEEKEKKKPLIKKKKNLMPTWEDLYLSFSKDEDENEDEEVNLCLILQFRTCKHKLDNWLPLQISSQTVINPKWNVIAITLRSSKELP
ncbi:hypothetical protein CR513_23976, partial [Mucuna pruriens]